VRRRVTPTIEREWSFRMTATSERSVTVPAVEWVGMREWLSWLRHANPRLLDVALAAGVLGTTLVWIAAQDPQSGGGLAGFDAFAAALVAAACVPLAWRRRAPLAVLLIVAGAAAVYAWLDSRAELVVPLGVAAYSASVHEDRWPAIAAILLATIAATSVVALSAPEAIANWVEALVGISTLALLPILLGRIVANRRRWIKREREEAARDAVAGERARIARELHDVVTHAMGVMVVQAGAGRRVLDRDRDKAAEAFRRIEESGRTGLVEMRRLLGIFRSDADAPALLPQPGLERLDELVESMQGAGLHVDAVVEGMPRPLPPGADLTAYRVVQEALTNTLRHAEASHARILLRFLDETLEIEVADDGRGPPAQGIVPGRGLVGMRERLTLFGGSLETAGRADGGFVVKARVPSAEDR
jgi:signal transduction histidine kinase